ncbi:MAG TPA: hypothetical protein VH439_05450 [Gemmatimonadales bacterium]
MIAIHEPDVVFSDLALTLLGGYFAARLKQSTGAIIMAALASAALWGAIFHAFFPTRTATPAGFGVWMLVAFSIIVVAAALLGFCLSLLGARASARRTVIAVYAACCAVLVLFVDESFAMIVRFYAPVLLLAIALAAREAVRTGGAAWRWIAGGLVLSAVAALAQQYRVALHPAYFNHNAVYHVIQAAALVLLYFGFVRTPLGVVEVRARHSGGRGAF